MHNQKTRPVKDGQSARTALRCSAAAVVVTATVAAAGAAVTAAAAAAVVVAEEEPEQDNQNDGLGIQTENASAAVIARTAVTGITHEYILLKF